MLSSELKELGITFLFAQRPTHSDDGVWQCMFGMAIQLCIYDCLSVDCLKLKLSLFLMFCENEDGD